MTRQTFTIGTRNLKEKGYLYKDERHWRLSVTEK